MSSGGAFVAMCHCTCTTLRVPLLTPFVAEYLPPTTFCLDAVKPALSVGFRFGNSPYAPAAGQALTSTYWRHWLASTNTGRPSSSNGRPVLFSTSCFNGTTGTCKPNTNLFMYSACASDNREVLPGINGAPMQFVVHRGTQGMTYGEPSALVTVSLERTWRLQMDIFLLTHCRSVSARRISSASMFRAQATTLARLPLPSRRLEYGG